MSYVPASLFGTFPVSVHTAVGEARPHVLPKISKVLFPFRCDSLWRHVPLDLLVGRLKVLLLSHGNQSKDKAGVRRRRGRVPQLHSNFLLSTCLLLARKDLQYYY